MAVAPGDVEDFWPICEPWLVKATALSRKVGLQEMLQGLQLLHASMQLWVITDAREVYGAFVTGLSTYPSGWKVCQVLALGGREMGLWKDRVRDRVVEYSRAEGCDALELVGVRGTGGRGEDGLAMWGRVFPELEETERVFSLEVR